MRVGDENGMSITSIFVIVAICSLLICFIATMYPSYQASKKDPVEALRYE